MAKQAVVLAKTGNEMTINKQGVKFSLAVLPEDLNADQMRQLVAPAFKGLIRALIADEAEAFNSQYDQGQRAVETLVRNDKKKSQGFIPLTGKDDEEKLAHARNIVGMVMGTRWSKRDWVKEPITLAELLSE
jgi:hypothetical protein